MYGGASQEDPNHGSATFLGTVDLGVTESGASVINHQVCNAALVADFHVSVQPLPAGGVLADCGTVQPLRPPGGYNCNNLDCAGCEVGKPCCIAVHWATDYDSCVASEGCTFI